MKKLLVALSALALSTATAFASGASRPSLSFAGTYTYVSGTALVFGSSAQSTKVEVACPPQIHAVAGDQGAVLALNSTFPSFYDINKGVDWNGTDYAKTYTTSTSLIYEEGNEFDSAVYRYSVEQQKDGSYKFTTTSSNDACVYTFAP